MAAHDALWHMERQQAEFAERILMALRGFEDPVRLFEVRWRE